MDDPLDRNDFDPVKYINDNFPTEDSLDNLDTYLVGLNSKIVTLDEEISKSIQTQSCSGPKAAKVLLDVSNFSFLLLA